VETFAGGIVRVTLPMPSRPGHVHSYLLPGADGWTVVDTGLGLPDAKERWAAVLAALDGPVARIFITHFHPDHVGAAADLAGLTGAPVYQGALDYEQCERTWRSPGRQELTSAWLRANSGACRSTPRTQCPCDFRCDTRWWPMNPPAPVTRMRDFAIRFLRILAAP